MKTIKIQYLYFDDKVRDRCKENVSCRSYGEGDQLTKEQILTALENYVRN
ncbi:MAG: hypothetical protein UV19_C0023G0010 [Parcubacteria group bacterium GW2011_GWA2_42_28]|nr:MAG: hypothetical protein UV19_C0023G0010 [Parcubacteria group bacterium GW2011_GWA2_42_28]